MSDAMLPSPWRTGFRGRCPRCGEGRLYKSFLKVTDKCAVCDLDLSREDAGDGAVPFIVFLVGAICAGFGVWMNLVVGAPIWLSVLLLTVLCFVLVMVLLPKTKGLLIALQYINRAGDTGQNTFED